MTVDHFLALLFGELIAHATKFLNLMRDVFGLPPITDEDVKD